MSARPERALGAWLWLMVAAALASQTALNLVRPVTTYKLLALEAGPLAVGIVTAVYALLPLVSAMWLGRLAARLGGLRHMMAIGCVLLAAGAAGIALAPTLALVAAGSALLGMGHLVFTVAGQAAVAKHVPDDRLDAGFGWFTAAYSAGQLVGPLIAGLLLGADDGGSSPGRDASIALALAIAAGVSLLALPALWAPWARPGPLRRLAARAAADPVEAHAQDGSPPRPPGPAGRATMGRILRVPGVPSHLLASLALLGMVDILTAFLPIVAEQAGIGPAIVGALLAVRGGASILSRAFLPWLSARLSSKALLLTSLYGAGLALAVPPALITEPWLAGAGLFAGGFCLGLGQPITMSLVSVSVPATWRGPALAVRLVGNRLGQVVLPLAAGLATVGLGPAGAIWFSCALLAVSAVEKSVRR